MKPRIPNPSHLALPLATTLAALLASPATHAALRYWEGGTGNWVNSSTPLYSSWSTSISGTTDPTTQPGASDDLIFNTTAGASTSNVISHSNGNRAALSLTFNTSGTSNFRAGGSSTAASTLTIGSGGITMNTGAGSVTIGQTPTTYGIITVALGNNQTWTNNSTGSLTVNGPITGASRSLTKNGTGTLVLNGANTFSGGFVLNNGLVVIGVSSTGTAGSPTNGAFGSGATAAILNGGSLRSTTSADTTVSNALSIGGDLAFSTLASEKSLTLSGPVTLTGSRTLTVDLGSTVSGEQLVISGAIGENASGYGLTKAGSGSLRLSGLNTYTGATSVTGGTLQIANYDGLDNTSSITVSGGTSQLQLLQQGSGSTSNSIDKSLSLHGTLSTGGGSGTNLLTQTWAGAVTLAGNSLITNNGNSTFIFTNTVDLGANQLTFQTDRDGSRISGNIIGTGGSFVKTGIRNLVLSGTNTFTGTFSLNAGTVNLGAAEDVNVSGPLGKQLANAAGTIVLGGGTLQYSAVNQFDYSGRFSTAAGQSYNVDTNSQNVTWAAALTSTGGALTKSGLGTLLLTGPNTYDGTTTVNAGILNTTAAASLSGYNASGKVVFNGGTIAGQVGGSGWTTAEVDSLLANATKTSGALGIDTTNGSLTQWAGFTTANFGANLGLTKLGANTLTLDQANDYTGTTTIGEGTLAFTTANTLSGDLVFGVSAGSTTTGNLDLSAASAAFGSLAAQTNSTTANTIDIGSGKTLQINGAVTVGTASGSTTTRLTATGLGTLSVGSSGTPTDANMQIGAGTGDNSGNNGTLDLSGLSTFYANLGTGTFRVGSPTNAGGSGGGTGSTAILAGNSTIQATALIVGSQDGASAFQSLRLGDGTNTLNADTITVGTSGRSNANIIFDGANGTVTVRGLTGGTSRANLTMASTSFGTGTSITATFDTTDHNADLMFGNMLIAQRSGSSSGSTTATFNFNQGTLDADNLLAGSVTSSTNTGNATGNINLSGGTATFNSTSNPLRLGVNADESRAATGNLNISGTASVSVAANNGVSIRLGDATVAGGTATGALDLTGGTLTVAGDIIRGSTTGTSNATLTLNGAGAILDMSGNDITGLTNITYTDGTIKNLGIVNTGMALAGSGSRVFDQGTGVTGEIQGDITGTDIGLDKQGDGKLTLSGTSSYTGATNVTAGTLIVSGNISTSITTTVADNATLGGGGTVADLIFAGGSSFDIFEAVNNTDSLASTTITFSTTGFGIDNLVSQGAAVDWGTVANGIYTLITGTLDETNLGNFGLANAYDIGGGRSAYFSEGSLQLVVVPEPRAVLLGGLGLLALLRRRRH